MLVKVGITPGYHPHPDFLPEDKDRMLRNPQRPYQKDGGNVNPRNGLNCCFQVWPRFPEDLRFHGIIFDSDSMT